MIDEEIDYDAALLELSELFVKSSCMTIMELNGFFAAIATNPTLIRPGEWLEAAGIHEIDYESIDQANMVLAAVMGLYNHVNGALREGVYLPLCVLVGENENRQEAYAQWCTGYMEGVELDYARWHSATHDDVVMGLFQIDSFTLSDEKLKPMIKDLLEDKEAKISTVQEFRRDAESTLANLINWNYQYWLEKRGSDFNAGMPHQNEDHKIGRNDPCVCGSGKKFKKCCLH